MQSVSTRETTQPDEYENIILITVDSLRADHCSFMGYESKTTPTLDRLADQGLVFENAIAPGPSTSESVPALFTGKYPFPRQDRSSAIDERIDQIEPHMQARSSLAERLSDIGYQTAAFTPNPFTSRYFGYGSGFDHYQDFLEGSRGSIYEQFFEGMLSGSQLYMPIRILLNWIQREEAFKPWESFYDQIISWAQQATEPYFIWIFLMDVHHPYLAGGEYQSLSRPELYYANWKLRHQNYEPPFSEHVHKNLVQAYDDSIRYTDSFLSRIIEDLDSDDPTYIITSDHGESFGEHGTYEHHGGAFGQHGQQEYHSYLYEENIHVPLVVYNGDSSGRVADPMSLRQVPNLAVDIGLGNEIDRDGYSRQIVTAQTMEAGKVAVRTNRYKYIEAGDNSELYDLTHGEHEQLDAPDLRRSLADYCEVTRQTLRDCESVAEKTSHLAEEHHL